MPTVSGSQIIHESLQFLHAACHATRDLPDVAELDLHTPLLAMERFTRIIENPQALAIATDDLERRIIAAYTLATGVEATEAYMLPIDGLCVDLQNHRRERNQRVRPDDVCTSLLKDDLEKLWDGQPTDSWLRADAKEQLQLTTLGLLERALTVRITDDGLDEMAEAVRNTAALIGLLLITSRIRAQGNLTQRLSGLEELLALGVIPIGHSVPTDSWSNRASRPPLTCVAVSFLN